MNAAPLGLISLLALGITQMDKQIAARFLGLESAGHLVAAALLVFGITELLGTPQLTAFLPLHARLHGDLRAAQIPERMSYFMLLWTLPLTAGISLFAPALVVLLFRSPGFGNSGPVLALLIWTVPLIITSNIFSQAVMLQNRQRRLLLIRGMALALNIVLNVLLLRLWGDLRSVALASVASEIFVLGLVTRELRHYGIRWRRLGRRVTRLAAVVVAVALVTWLLLAGFAAWGLVIALGGYGLALWRGGLLDPGDRELLDILWRMLPFTRSQAAR